MPAIGIQPAEPLSREDALSKRLKTLRNQRDGGSRSTSEDPPPPYTETTEGTTPSRAQTQPTSAPSPRAKNIQVGDGGDHVDEDEDRTLDEIFDSLVLDDDHWSVSDDGADDAKRVEELLGRLKRGHETHAPSPGRTPNDPELNDGDDDSEGEEMSRQVENVLSRTMDELKLEGPNESSQPETGTITVNTSDADNSPTQTNTADRQATADTELALPAVPHTPTRDEHPLPDLPTTPRDKDEDGNGSALTLPTVPSILQDPVPASKAGDPFEASIEARLAALKGPGHNPVRTDAFGLPSAPTFQPEDRPVAGVVRRRLGGYTDDDQKTWCIVCLEDATVRCMGCDGDVYCARCWREMHVGPQAGYDERGHRWEKFDPRER